MARASRVKTVKGGPQGPDAKVVVLIPTVGEMRHQRKVTLSLMKEHGDDAEEVEANANQYLADHVLEWNWTDDEGKVFDLPRTNQAVLAELTQEELNFIAQVMAGQNPEEVADRKK